MTRKVPDISQFTFTIKDIMNYESPDDFDNDGHFELFSGMTDLQRLAVGIHALVEYSIASLLGITADQITKWDTEDKNGAYDPKMYEKNHNYRAAHLTAEMVERLIVEAAGISWKEYIKELDAVPITWNKDKWKK